MKQKKWMTYLLALLVVFIWGVILQRVLVQVNPEERFPALQNVNSPVKEKLPSMQPDTFSLLLDYPDPFLKGGKIVPEQVSTSIDPRPLPHSGSAGVPLVHDGLPVTQSAPADQITYLGFVQNPTSKKRIAIINYNSRETMLSEGESFGKIQLVHILDGAVKLRVGKELKHIKQSL
jgi:hypothetical protein